jgi:hypothetical protein
MKFRALPKDTSSRRYASVGAGLRYRKPAH